VLPDGTPVEGESCHVFCEEPHATQFVNRYHFLSDDCMRVPVGVELHLVALTRARPEDARHVLVGRRVLIADASEAEPQKVQITLSESFDYDPPPSDAQVIEIFESDILSTLDLRILDKSGRPLSRDTEVVLELRGSEKISLHPTDGWIRLRGIPGTHPVRLQVGDESEAFDLAIPWSGYGRLEKNMRIGP
jgi:hypothetical protein